MAPFPIGPVAELPPGSRKIVSVAGRSIGVFNLNGRLYALRNRCPHQGGPLCLGSIGGTPAPGAPGEYDWGRDGEIIRCPWHGWEFDITNGLSIFDPNRMRVRSYDVTIAQGREDEPRVETFDVSVRDGTILVHV